MSSGNHHADPPEQEPPLLVLIAEDEEPIAYALADLIEGAGYRTLVAQHGERALELARKHHPALIITDLMMPYMSGREVIAVLRAQKATPEHPIPPIILMSAASQTHTRDAGADAVLNKPFDLEEIETLLHQFLPPAAPKR